MDNYVVYVKKKGKWKKYSEHDNYERAKINADVLYKLKGFDSKIEYDGQIVLHLRGHNG